MFIEELDNQLDNLGKAFLDHQFLQLATPIHPARIPFLRLLRVIWDGGRQTSNPRYRT